MPSYFILLKLQRTIVGTSCRTVVCFKVKDVFGDQAAAELHWMTYLFRPSTSPTLFDDGFQTGPVCLLPAMSGYGCNFLRIRNLINLWTCTVGWMLKDEFMNGLDGRRNTILCRQTIWPTLVNLRRWGTVLAMLWNRNTRSIWGTWWSITWGIFKTPPRNAYQHYFFITDLLDKFLL